MKRLLTLFLLCSSPLFAWSAGTTVANAPGTSGTSRAMTISSTSAGVILCVGIVAQNASGGAPTVTSVTDNGSGGSNTYTQYGIFQHAGDNNTQAIYCTGETTHASVTSVTCTMSANVTSFLDCYVTPFTKTVGITTSQDTGITGTNSGSSASAATASVTPSGTDNLVVAIAQAPSATAVNNSYTLASNADGNGWAYKLGVAHVATTTTFTTTSGGWWTLIVSVKGVSSAAAPNMPPVVL
jgi:hypothetical protein